MNYLIDTCVIAELAKDNPNTNVLNYLNSLRDSEVLISVITIGELKNGISSLANGRKKKKLEQWLHNEMLIRFDGRVISLDTATMLKWGELVSRLSLKGQTMPIMDSLIAAQCNNYGLKLITRNIRDFQNSGITTINPWENS